MKTLSDTESRANCAPVLDAVVNNREETIITRAGMEPFPTASSNPELTAVRRHMKSPATRARHVPGLSTGVELRGHVSNSSRAGSTF